MGKITKWSLKAGIIYAVVVVLVELFSRPFSLSLFSGLSLISRFFILLLVPLPIFFLIAFRGLIINKKTSKWLKIGSIFGSFSCIMILLIFVMAFIKGGGVLEYYFLTPFFISVFELSYLATDMLSYIFYPGFYIMNITKNFYGVFINLMVGSSLILSIAIWFGVGALIGYIYTKIKSKKQESGVIRNG